MEAPALVKGNSGAPLQYVAFLADLGSADGIMAFPLSVQDSVAKALSGETRAAISFLNDESYSEFDRDLFIATLDDWGWYGTDEPPACYTGSPWSK